MLAPSVYAANTSIHYYNQTKVYYELNVDTTPGYLKLNFYTNETPPPPVEVFLRKGTGENQSDVFNITNLTISGRDYGAGFDNFQRCILNLEEGTNLNMSGYADISGKLSATNANITAEYLKLNAYAIFEMQGGNLSLTGTSPLSSQKIYGTMSLNNVEFSANYNLIIAGGNFGASEENGYKGYDLNCADVVFSGNTTMTGTEIEVRDTNKLSVLDNAVVDVNSLDASNLSVSTSAQIHISSASALSVDALTLVLNDLSAVDLSKIFITDNGDAIAFDQDLTNITVTDQLGNEFQDVVFDFNEDGNVIGIASVPEPSTYAAVFSLLAAAFAVCRRRK